MASRHHVEGITATINEALGDADVSIEDIDAIAVTEGPGLIGALLIGVNAAKALHLLTISHLFLFIILQDIYMLIT